MERVHERCAALDVHKAQVTACVHAPDQRGVRSELCAEFSTMTADLLGLRDWLLGLGITHVAMEATGVYWKPVYYLLEDDFELLLVNAQHVKNVPGRKTDVKDAQWLCQLLEHGLLRSSFVPPKPIRELRDLTRYRKSLVWERAREANRLQKVLEDANIKLACIASRPLGASGKAMLRELCEGNNDPVALADLAKGKLRAKLPLLRRDDTSLLAGKTAPGFPAVTRADVRSRARGRIASHVRANTASYTREGKLMPRVIVTTAVDVGKPRLGGPVLMDEEVDLMHLDSPNYAPQFLERIAIALEGAHRAEVRLARQEVG